MATIAPRYFFLLTLFAVGACVPTAARKNARLEGGFDVGLVAALQHVEEGEKPDGTTADSTEIPHLEVDLQFAHRLEDGSGFALQAKLPVNLVFTTLDFYYQLPENNSSWFFGFGAELGVLPGVYAVATHYLDDDLYISLTPRVLNAQERDQRAVLINPQLSVGLAGSADMSLFASFAHHTGRGYNFHVDLFNTGGPPDYRKNYWLAGASARF